MTFHLPDSTRSEHNKRVADSRWSKILEKERALIRNDECGAILKSAICGFLAGDGNIRVNHNKTHLGRLNCSYEVRFFPDDVVMLQTYCSALRRVYSKAPSVTDHDAFFEVRLTSRTVVQDILSLSTFGIHSWSVPKSLFDIPGAKQAWLRAFFSAEAYVNNRVIRCSVAQLV
jgi:hypothetical protein